MKSSPMTPIRRKSLPDKQQQQRMTCPSRWTLHRRDLLALLIGMVVGLVLEIGLFDRTILEPVARILQALW